MLKNGKNQSESVHWKLFFPSNLTLPKNAGERTMKRIQHPGCLFQVLQVYVENKLQKNHQILQDL